MAVQSLKVNISLLVSDWYKKLLTVPSSLRKSMAGIHQSSGRLSTDIAKGMHTCIMMPFLNLLHRYKLKHLVVLCAVSVALLFLMVLVLMPRPDSLKHSLLWQNGSGNTPRELSQAYDDAFFFNSTDDELNNSSEEERDYDENAGKVDEDGDEEEGEEEEGEQEDEAMEMMKTSHPDASLVAGNSRAVCIGSNASLGEVEDLLCMPRPNYEKSMKNPCWWETITQTPPPWINAPPKSVKSLSCLPYFHILCCSKSGTTDMYRRISMHPDIVPNFGMFGKERLYWGWAMYGYRNRRDKGDPVPFYKYIKGFGILARYLEKAVVDNPKDLKRLVTLDGSPPDMWDLRGWTQLPQNRNLRHPAVITPHLMRHLYRDPKFLILVREPVERLYTAYLFHGLGHSAEEFHEDAVEGIAMFDRCLAEAQDRIECFVNASVINSMPVDLHYSCYTVYFEEWLKVFPRRHFLFLRTEEYSKDLRGSLAKIFKFLDLPKPTTKEVQRMVQAPISYHTRQKDVAGPMLNETRDMLRKWFQQWNEELAHVLRDKGYLWNDVDIAT